MYSTPYMGAYFTADANFAVNTSGIIQTVVWQNATWVFNSSNIKYYV